jgi:hypothetical protein
LLTAYLIAVAFGGTLLTASLVMGGKDADAGHGDGDAGDGGHDGDGHGGAFDWLPLTSLRFWTFFFTFGGAVGTALTLLGSPASALIVAGAAVGVGAASGIGSVAAVKALAAGSADSSTSPAELVGTTGHLLLGAGPSEPGKVRVEVKGRVQDFIATSDEPLPTGARVLIVSSQADGRLVVTKNEIE